MATYESEPVDLRIAQARVAELERQLAVERKQGLDAEHRLRHAQEGLRRLQTQIERHGEAETRRLEGAGASKEELALAGADQAVTLALVASAITSSIVCGCAEHAVGRMVGRPVKPYGIAVYGRDGLKDVRICRGVVGQADADLIALAYDHALLNAAASDRRIDITSSDTILFCATGREIPFFERDPFGCINLTPELRAALKTALGLESGR